MLRRTFCHLPGVGLKAEQQLWAAGIDSWGALAQADATLGARRRERLLQHLEESQRQLDLQNAAFFAGSLPSQEHWRLYSEFRESVAYVDIETTGLGGPGDYITTIALYDGRTIRHYVQGQNLAEFARDIRDYRLLVTYNGKCFDLPILRGSLGIPLDQAHIDLRYVLSSLGYTGGLKGCERQLGLDRGDLADVDGFFAVLLWRDYHHHRNPHALETLLAYNIRDVVNLEPLLIMAYNLKTTRTPFGPAVALPAATPPAEPFRPHAPTIERLQRQYIPYAPWPPQPPARGNPW
ncbi:MAG TPA: ribonuclease H-like domain-containing protein [Verrucomicrobiota bacterium]|nr:ribonuclease H-like domain-containing protein [Verrucomicrobiota bacterium]HNU52473.1 ribonuclease H-like domain-containing protein [Verrucomicrobiota bacterium]